ncbi:hypothetical protein B0H10DRAFT_56510 [Mycena sp. CBHHK59/15]|nr:hypothetical protein B0H10DRAFT_56510 [Mycena sp. CBHHK59/15]
MANSTRFAFCIPHLFLFFVSVAGFGSINFASSPLERVRMPPRRRGFGAAGPRQPASMIYYPPRMLAVFLARIAIGSCNYPRHEHYPRQWGPACVQEHRCYHARFRTFSASSFKFRAASRIFRFSEHVGHGFASSFRFGLPGDANFRCRHRRRSR